MSAPTPVTTSVINAESGSQRSSAATPKAGNQSNQRTSTGSPVPAKKSAAATTAPPKAPTTVRVPRYPAQGSPSRLPKNTMTTAPARGRSTARETSMSVIP